MDNLTKPKILLVEGIEELFFFKALLKRKKFDDIQIISINGKPKISSTLSFLATDPWSKTIGEGFGLLLDADTNPSGTEESIKYHLGKHGFAVPNAALVKAKKNQITTIYNVIPSTSEIGMLETICLKSVTSDPVFNCVESFFSCVENALIKEEVPKNKWKAYVHAFLATRKIPDKRLGEAALAGYWPLDHPVFEDLHLILKILHEIN